MKTGRFHKNYSCAGCGGTIKTTAKYRKCSCELHAFTICIVTMITVLSLSCDVMINESSCTHVCANCIKD